MRRRLLREELPEESGAVSIVEATFVFPIMFFIIFILLMIGSAYFQQARVERIVTEAAVEAAARCANPALDVISEEGSVPDGTKDMEIMPYRYIFKSHAKSICKDVASEMLEDIEAFGTLGFRGMEVQLDGNPTVEPKIYLMVSSVTAKCDFHVTLPIRMIFTDDDLIFYSHVEVKEPVGDASELVRNVGMIKDGMERNNEITELFGSISGMLGNVAKFIN